MICPIMTGGLFADPTILKTTEGGVDCRKEGCAWWIEHFGMCCQAVVAHNVAVQDRAWERKISMADRK